MPEKKSENPRSRFSGLVSSAFQFKDIIQLSNCTLCPRNCGANRFSDKLGYCKSDASFRVSSVCVHKGEEPVISGEKGICNIFFPHCNLQCIYCQNHEISGNFDNSFSQSFSFDDLIGRICSVLDTTENIVGFVSPSHYIPQMLAIIWGIKDTGRQPVFVYNTNGYDSVPSLQMLEGIIDVYLPDFKYSDGVLAETFSQGINYPEVALSALKEMYRQKGSSLILNERNLAQSGIIVRHLVLPGATSNSMGVLSAIAGEVSPNLHISLMSQYFPTANVKGLKELNRVVKPDEYQSVVDKFHELGFYRGWIQDLESHASFRPDFSNNQPFEL